jgi:hypothetical protein
MSMLRRTILGALALSAVSALLFAGPTYGGGALRFAGKTSQKRRIALTVSGGAVRGVRFTIVDRCPRKRRLIVKDSGFPSMAIKRGGFSGKFTAKAPATATVSVSGHISRRTVSGTLQDRTKSYKWHKFCSGAATFKLRAS